jgi:hypothetical protein
MLPRDIYEFDPSLQDKFDPAHEKVTQEFDPSFDLLLQE